VLPVIVVKNQFFGQRWGGLANHVNTHLLDEASKSTLIDVTAFKKRDQ
jgi:hypothetical protein